MRALAIAVAIVVLLPVGRGFSPAAQSAQPAVPRASDGKPDLTGVWQGSSTRPGKWEDANNGLGVGGTGKHEDENEHSPVNHDPAREPPHSHEYNATASRPSS